MKLFIATLLVSFSLIAFAGVEKQISKKEYVEQWRTTAVQQMIQYNIPASITMAQAILESGSGNSELARLGKNHFGIKCGDWDGERMYMDDDSKGECFRVYNSAEESFLDHSDFLKNKKRYANLFALELTDYKAWSKGLKEAGYATNPKYPDLLIGLIEDLKLNELDLLGTQNNEISPSLVSATSTSTSNSKHAVFVHSNKVKYVVAKKGDTFYKISKELGLTLTQLYRYNDFDSKKDVLEAGDLIYIHPKRNRSKKKFIFLEEAMSVNQLSQKEAIDPEKILKHNNIDSPNTLLRKGEKITLR